MAVGALRRTECPSLAGRAGPWRPSPARYSGRHRRFHVGTGGQPSRIAAWHCRCFRGRLKTVSGVISGGIESVRFLLRTVPLHALFTNLLNATEIALSHDEATVREENRQSKVTLGKGT